MHTAGITHRLAMLFGILVGLLVAMGIAFSLRAELSNQRVDCRSFKEC